MATVNKDFKIKSGLIVEGTTGTINGENILTTSQASTDHIVSIVGGTTLVTSVSGNLAVTDGDLAINESGLATDLAGTRLYSTGTSINVDVEGIQDDLVANGIATTTDISTAISNAASNYDAAGSALTAQSNAENYADSLASNYDAAGAASTAENNAKGYADSLATNYDAAGAATQALSSANTYTDNAVADLVGTAPATLDTLQELATALQDNPDIITNLESVASGKQNSFTAGTGLEFNVMGDILKVSDNTYDAHGAAATAESNANGYTDTAIQNLNLTANFDAYGAASQAEQNAKNYADGLAENYDVYGSATSAEQNANSYTDTAISNLNLSSSYDAYGAASQALSDANGYTDNAVANGDALATPQYLAINVNDVAKQIAATSSIATASSAVVYSWNQAEYRSAKLVVKVANGVHTELSEILVTLDTNDNVAITEFGLVGTNGELGTVTADIGSEGVRIVVATANNNSTVTVVGTLIA